MGADPYRKSKWRPRKQAHLRELEHADADLRRVYSADKIHNMRDTLSRLYCESRAAGAVRG